MLACRGFCYNRANCDKTKILTKLKLWRNSNSKKSQTVTNEKKNNRTKQIVSTNYCDQMTPKILWQLKCWQNFLYDKPQIMTKFLMWHNLNGDKTWIAKKNQIWKENWIVTETRIVTNCQIYGMYSVQPFAILQRIYFYIYI